MTKASSKKLQIDQTTMSKRDDKEIRWFLIDAEGKVLGRLASEIAKILRGKHSTTFTPHVDCGDGVIVINADKIAVTGNKEAQKIYRYHTSFPGGLREMDYRSVKERKPTYILEQAVKGMLPKNKLGRQQLKRLRLVVGGEHQMEAQKPMKVSV